MWWITSSYLSPNIGYYWMMNPGQHTTGIIMTGQCTPSMIFPWWFAYHSILTMYSYLWLAWVGLSYSTAGMIMTGMYTGVVMTGKCNTSMSIICQYSVRCYNIILVSLLLVSALLVKVSPGSILSAWCCLLPNKTIPVSISSAGTKLLVGQYATGMTVTGWYATGMLPVW